MFALSPFVYHCALFFSYSEKECTEGIFFSVSPFTETPSSCFLISVLSKCCNDCCEGMLFPSAFCHDMQHAGVSLSTWLLCGLCGDDSTIVLRVSSDTALLK